MQEMCAAEDGRAGCVARLQCRELHTFGQNAGNCVTMLNAVVWMHVALNYIRRLQNLPTFIHLHISNMGKKCRSKFGIVPAHVLWTIIERREYIQTGSF